MVQKVLVLNGTLKIKPIIRDELLREICEECFGLTLNLEKAPVEAGSFDDRNYIVHGHLKPRGNEKDELYQQFDKFVIKIYNVSETPRYELYNTINSNLFAINAQCKPDLNVPYPIFGIDKENDRQRYTLTLFDIPLHESALFENCNCEELVRDGDLINADGRLKAIHIVRLTAYVPGKLLEHKDMTQEIAFSWGKAIARLTLIMQDLPTPDVDPRERWVVNVLTSSDMLYVPYVKLIENEKQRQILINLLDQFRRDSLPRLQSLKHKQWVHGDIAVHNILWDFQASEGATKDDGDILRSENDGNKYCVEGGRNIMRCGVKGDKNLVTGIIDFDDAILSYRIFDLAFALQDILASTKNHELSLKYARELYQGYSSILELTESEMCVLFDIVLILFVRNVLLVNFQAKQIDPGNAYVAGLLDTNFWESFQFVLDMGTEQLMKKML